MTSADPPAAAVPSAPRQSGPRWRRALTRGITRNVVALGLVSLFTDVSSEMLVYLIPLYLANVLLAPAAVIGLIEGVAESTASVSSWSAALSPIACRGGACSSASATAPRSRPRRCISWPWPGRSCCSAASAIGSGRGSGPRRETR
jgi:hypothetical protein